MAENEQLSAEELATHLGDAIHAQQELDSAQAILEDRREARDREVLRASRLGASRRALAASLALTPGRIQQIVDAARTDAPDGSSAAPFDPAPLLNAFAPQDNELAVLSVLAARSDRGWSTICGSLLTVPSEQALMSWPQWHKQQPVPARYRDPFGEPLDLGPQFIVSPFDGLLAARQIIDSSAWDALVRGMKAGALQHGLLYSAFTSTSWAPTGLLGTLARGSSFHDVVAGARRPVLGLGAVLSGPDMPESESTLALSVPPDIPRGGDLARMTASRRVLHWPIELLGIEWLGTNDYEPPRKFVVGRAAGGAWITGVKPAEPTTDLSQLEVVICWESATIDPLSCTLVLRTERNGIPEYVHSIKLSDLPSNTPVGRDPLTANWQERTLTCRVPRGAAGTAWGVALFSSSGDLLDDMPVARRVESVKFSFTVAGNAGPGSSVQIGDRRPRPEAQAIADALGAASAALQAARRAAAQRRLSNTAELVDYLRWRFSCRSGELLILDRHLLAKSDIDRTLAVLTKMGRPIRALCRSVPEINLPANMSAQRLPHGGSDVHDRVWIVGDTGLLLGGSVNTFAGTGRRPATTVTELSWGDVQMWRELFDEWWKSPPSQHRN